jgi:Plasmid encoded RepA protein
MGEIHELVVRHGRRQARELVPVSQRMLVDIAAEILADEAQRIGITYSGFCLTGFPHKRLKDDAAWEKPGHQVTLLVEPGRLKTGPGPATLFGVPYGARARIIMIYLQTQALRSGGRQVQLGRSMRDWMTRMGLSAGGETARALRDQARRISACHIKFFWSAANGQGREGDGFKKGSIVTDGFFFREEEAEDRQGLLFDDVVTLDETFYEALRDHPVPLLESAIKQLKEKSLALDVYIWLAYRLHSLKQPTPISWASLFAQFGTGFRLSRQFKPYFLESLGAATAAYPDAKIEVGDVGIVMHPSRPPVAKLG